MLENGGNELPDEGLALLRELGDDLRPLDARVKRFDAQIAAREPACRRLSAIPGIGVLTATALVPAVGGSGEFRNGREMAASLGLVPRQHSTGGRPTLLGVNKRGDRYLRSCWSTVLRLLWAPRGVGRMDAAAGRSTCGNARDGSSPWWRSPTRTRALRSVADRLIAVACAMLENQTLFAPDHPRQRHAA